MLYKIVLFIKSRKQIIVKNCSNQAVSGNKNVLVQVLLKLILFRHNILLKVSVKKILTNHS